jgi:uncharacterized protein (DUF362 family)
MLCGGNLNRRNFFRTSLATGALLASAPWRTLAALDGSGIPTIPSSRVSLTAGEDRIANTFNALKPFAREMQAAIGSKRVIIKPNNVSIDNQLSASHVDSLEGILEFLKSIDKLQNVAIAESAANGPSLDGFDNYKYMRLASKYPVKFIDLDTAGFEIMHLVDEKDFRPHALRMSKVLLDPNSFLISAAKFKTHDRVVATLSLKNIVVGAPIKDLGFTWGSRSKAGAHNDKPIVHGSGFRGINFNLFALAKQLHPHLAVIDGYRGMEGEGPVAGTPVEHRVAVASMDWLAADRVAVELMGIDYAKVGYLNYCAQAGLGQGELGKIEIIGPSIKDHIKTYKLADNLEQQLVWMKPMRS